jgi:hypothetical protein
MAVRLGELLLRERRVTPTQLQEALTYQRSNGGRLGASLVKLGILSDDDITGVMSRQYGVAAVDLSQITIDPALIRLIPAETAGKYNVIPVGRSGNTLTLAMTDPTNVFAMDDIKFRTGLNVEPVVASETAIQEAVKQHYGAASAPVSRNGDNGKGSVDLVGKGVRRPEPRVAGRDPGCCGRRRDRRCFPREAERRGPGHSSRQRAVPGRDPARCQRHPHRALRKRTARAIPHRRRPAVRDDAAAQISRSARLAHQDHGAARHF